ncbi:Holliday junction branch migration protein RuvA [Porphyromonas circumdentaria]|uniref:Holliday junction branch migration complex subunit RuvA n=1 Tax=Porphyromonas circumdentaria TaxID=29524 RepID=A0A1T4NCR3_9PORP|nr:Holliday junction branch migration protein RuvA [Porphyromonas circumdentaria]MBB6275627.1 Holliday junction DNA helicase RuvA [Porphyromonas circumdentaria]MDO4721870.1 Holliday junction branch migration protein RuvA [Porphyromonas circumdentaria]SJZ76925.1 Holliday junction DNA helicase subunit RuvA [Porphyromonas circumdentaria]
MIAYLEGKIDRLTPTNALIDCLGVGYDVQITLTDYTFLQGREKVRLWITEIIREDAHILFGFVREEARSFFEKLCSVSGVGPSTARLILSAYTPLDLATIIQNGSVDLLKNVKGIGLKTAQRIVVDLKGKIDLSSLGEEATSTLPQKESRVNAQVVDEAQRALKMLGFQDVSVRKVVKTLIDAEPTLSVEEIVKRALKML